MMTKKSEINTRKLISLFFLSLITLGCFAESSGSQWTFGAMKFELNKGQTEDAVTRAEQLMLPQGIIEKLSSDETRYIDEEESLSRSLYDLKKERTSLYLQLVAAEKKRDSLLLTDASDFSLKQKIKTQEKEIQSLEEKIEDNLSEQKKEEDKILNEKLTQKEGSEKEKTEFEKYKYLIENFFTSDSSANNYENMALYEADSTKLIEVSDFAQSEGPLSPVFEQEIMTKNVNGLLTGNFSLSDNYIMVETSVYIYPGARKIGTVSEIGSTKNTEWICSSLARQLVPVIANAIPVTMSFNVEPADADPFIYVDDVLQDNLNGSITLDSGVHTIQFGAEGYKTASTSYFFKGNRNYKIDAVLSQNNPGKIFLNLKKPVSGYFYGNGEIAEQTEKGSEISINGRPVIGEFVSEDGNAAFFYIPENKLKNEMNLVVDTKIFDREKYINTRRIWMYTSYSLLITSLLPTFYCYGNFSNYVNFYNRGFGEYEEALKWQKASYISIGISIGCGVLFGFELIRYLFAADSVLPVKAKIDKNMEKQKAENEKNNDNIDITEQEVAE